jgi:hypothetical protein
MTFDRQMIIQTQMLTTSSPLRYSSDDQETDPRSPVKGKVNPIITLMSSPYGYHRFISINRRK